MQRRPKTLWPWLLPALAVVFCLKFYHRGFILQTDVFLNLYLRDNASALWRGWDPYTLSYTGWYPIAGRLFPTTLISQWVLRTFFPDSLLASLVSLMVEGTILLALLALSCYALFRYYGKSPAGSVLGAILVTFAGFHSYSSVRELNLYYLPSLMAIPWTFLCLDKALREESARWAVAAGAAVGLSLWGGSDCPLFFAVPVLPFIVLEQKGSWRNARLVVLALAVGLLIGAVMVLPSLAYMGLTLRNVWAAGQALPQESAARILRRLLLPETGEPIDPNFAIYIGWPAAALALAGLAMGKPRDPGRSSMLALGAFCLLFLNDWGLPRWLVAPYLRWCALASLRLLGYRIFMVGLIPFAYFAATSYDALKTPAKAAIIPLVFLLLYRSNPAIPFYGAAAGVSMREPNERFRREIYEPLLSRETAPFRFFTFDVRKSFWAPRLGVDVAFDFLLDATTPKPLWSYASAIFPIKDGKAGTYENENAAALLGLYNVKYLLLPHYPGKLYRPTSVADVYENPWFFPRVFTTHQARFFASEERLLEALRQASPQEMRGASFLLFPGAAPRLSKPVAGDRVRLLERRPDRIAAEADMASPGWLNVSELWFPAWRAFVDGEAVPLLRGYGAFWSVFLDQGRHQVEFRFDDRLGRLTLAVSLLSLAGALIFLLKGP